MDHDGEVLESFVTKTRDKKAALKFLKKAMRKHGQPEIIVTDQLRSYGAALKEIGNAARQETAAAEQQGREFASAFPTTRTGHVAVSPHAKLQKFAAVHASVYNHFNQERSLSSRPLFKLHRAAALAEWRQMAAA